MSLPPRMQPGSIIEADWLNQLRDAADPRLRADGRVLARQIDAQAIIELAARIPGALAIRWFRIETVDPLAGIIQESPASLGEEHWRDEPRGREMRLFLAIDGQDEPAIDDIVMAIRMRGRWWIVPQPTGAGGTVVRIDQPASGGGKYSGRILTASASVPVADNLDMPEGMTEPEAEDALIVNLSENDAGSHVIPDGTYTTGIVIGNTTETPSRRVVAVNWMLTAAEPRMVAQISSGGKWIADWVRVHD